MPEKNPRRVKRAIIKEEYIAITGDMVEAVILNQMIYWSERVSDFDAFIIEERARQKQDGETESDFSLQHGWIYKSADQLKEEIMSQDSTRTINRKLDSLVEKKFLSRRRNPHSKYDHKYQYRVDFAAIVAALDANGYVLEGYAKLPTYEKKEGPANESQSTPNHNVLSNGQIVKSTGQNVASGGQCGVPKRQIVTLDGHSVTSNGHSVATIAESIPETTLEITPETILEKSSPSSLPAGGWTESHKTDDDKSDIAVFFARMGLEQLRHREAVPQLKALIADLWHTRRIGQDHISAATIREALSGLTPEILDAVLEKINQQEAKGEVGVLIPYMQRAILNAGRNAALAGSIGLLCGGDSHTPTYDLNEYVAISMSRLLDDQPK
ncbi:MAG: hypothetical protein ABF449_12480 [Ethanoligenens sp.]